jgi:hypothetical protein
MQHGFTAQAGQVTAQLSFTELRQLGYQKIQLTSGGTTAVELYVDADGVLRSGSHVLATLKLGSWYALQLVADSITGTFDAYLNGSLVGNDLPFAADVTSLDGLTVRTGESSTSDFFVNNVKLFDDLR